MKEPPRSSEPETGHAPEQLQERIRQRAFELYELRGEEDGHALDDWLEAESEVIRNPRS
jgi:hypothetical protein